MTSLFLTDEELGKKDDDHNRARPPFRPQHWAPARTPARKSVKRFGIALLVGLVVYLFIRNIPTDVPVRDQSLREPGPPAERNYNGPVTLPYLGDSLRAIYDTKGPTLVNRNVLFAASSLESAAALLPLACRMGSELRNYVHFVLMGGSQLGLDELRAANGIDDLCHVILHDARPDNAAESAETRLQASIDRAMFQISLYMSPQVVIVDGSGSEDALLLQNMRQRSHTTGLPLIQLPASAAQQLSWVAKLDSASLTAWNNVNVDILIQAPPGGSGGLIRLLRSLSGADFSGNAIPHLTIELPHVVDPPTARFLQTFQWPPAHLSSASSPARQLSLRHRISRQGLGEEESSVRFLESFWPSHPQLSHVLVLSPQAELSPQFFQYIKYSLLEYRHSNAALLQEWGSRLLGISLDLPPTHLDASAAFAPPTTKDIPQPPPDSAAEPTSFLWQAPNSNALLIFGEKWIELQGFVSRLVELQHRPSPPPPPPAEKLVSKRYPAWLEHVLTLSRARGYLTLYPGANPSGSLVTIHDELYSPPEEYAADAAGGAPETTEAALAPGPLLDSLPAEGSLAPFNMLPLLTWDGEVTELHKLDALASGYASTFRGMAGGCEGLTESDLVRDASARDLFCSKDN